MPRRRRNAFSKILVAYDGSPQSEKAIDVGFSLARAMDSRLVVLSVVRPPEVASVNALQALLQDAREHFSQAFMSIASAAAEQEIEIDTEVVVGDPAEQIIERAQSFTADVVLVGRRGTSSADRWALGATAERVLRYANCPVMVIA